MSETGLYNAQVKQAIADDDAQALSGLLDAGLALDERDEYDMPIVYRVCERRSLKCFHLLADRGAKLTGIMRDNLLHFAGWDASVTKRLLDAGCDARSIDQFGRNTIFNLAIPNGSPDALALLVAAGADLNLKVRENWDGMLPIHQVARCGHLPLMKRMVELGADPRTVSEKERTLLHHLTMSSSLDAEQYRNIVCWMLAQGIDIDAQEVYGETALHLAANRDDHEAVRVLLDLGAATHLRDFTTFPSTAEESATDPTVKAVFAARKINLAIEAIASSAVSATPGK